VIIYYDQSVVVDSGMILHPPGSDLHTDIKNILPLLEHKWLKLCQESESLKNNKLQEIIEQYQKKA